MHAFGAHLPLEKCKKPRTGRGFLRIYRGRADDPFRYIGFSTVCVFLFFDDFLLFSGIFLWEDYTGFIFKWATALFGKERDNMSKRFLSLFLAFVLCMSCLALPAFASDPYGP